MPESVQRVVVLRTSAPGQARVGALARWIRAMLPAALLVIVPLGVTPTNLPDDAITLDAQDVDASPLSVADALVRAASDKAEP